MAVPRAIAERVSRETAERLDIFAAELVRWQRALNLVAPSTIPDLWLRHIDDSLQLAELEGDARLWIDLGSGGGLPGLIVAAAEPARMTILVESDTRKAAFLRSTARRMGVTVEVRHERIEAAMQTLVEEGAKVAGPPHHGGIALAPQAESSIRNSQRRHPEEPAKQASRRTHNCDACFETRPPAAPQHDEEGEKWVGPGSQHVSLCTHRGIVVSARALASLDRLLAYAQPLLSAGAIGVFPKGRNAEAELTEAAKSWIFSAQAVPSRTDPEGRIIRIRDFAGPRT